MTATLPTAPRRPRHRARHRAGRRPASRGGWSAAARTTPRWVRPALLALLAGTGVLYLWDLAASGWANAFYSAAAQAGSHELGGVLLRLLRRRQLDHRRQAARPRCG